MNNPPQRNGTGITVIETLTPPRCGPCRQPRAATWNGRLPEAARLAGQPERAADYYVLVRGTTGLFRHECRKSQALNRDRIVARFVAPKGERR
jgi:hypothetical protein